MRIAVTDQGVVIPRDWFPDVEEVEVEKARDAVVVRHSLAHDPILELGKNPVDCSINDGSEHHDNYLYGGNS
ncbi:MAG: hypothetical protein V1753_09570 [Pseudomonadota bacterium]